MMVFVGGLQRQIRQGVKDIFGVETHEQNDLLTDLLTLTRRQLQRRCMQARCMQARCTKEDAEFVVSLFFK